MREAFEYLSHKEAMKFIKGIVIIILVAWAISILITLIQ